MKIHTIGIDLGKTNSHLAVPHEFCDLAGRHVTDVRWCSLSGGPAQS